jgi:RimJ/RimL family protein N-acetyltransferase
MSVLIRRATPSDADPIAAVFLAARRSAMPWLPTIHSDAETRWWMRTNVLATTVWVAEEGGQPIGFAALRGAVLEHLYVDPDAWDRGVGTALLTAVRAEPLDKIALIVFQRNARARRFYEALGFSLVALGTGAANEEREPDVYYEWHRLEPAMARP